MVTCIRTTRAGNLIVPPTITLKKLKIAYLNHCYRIHWDKGRQRVKATAQMTGVSERMIFAYVREGILHDEP